MRWLVHRLGTTKRNLKQAPDQKVKVEAINLGALFSIDANERTVPSNNPHMRDCYDAAWTAELGERSETGVLPRPLLKKAKTPAIL